MIKRNMWVKSSKSSASGNNCVEVYVAGNTLGVVASVTVRNSKAPYSSQIVFAADEWRAFLAGVKNGEFDL